MADIRDNGDGSFTKLAPPSIEHLAPGPVFNTLAIFYDEVHGAGASDALMPEIEERLLKWAAGDGREYVRSQGMIVAEDGNALAFDPDGRAHRLVQT